MLKLNSEQRSQLRSLAHSLDPVVMIGDAGLTDAVLKEIDVSLNAHELIKIRVFGDDRQARLDMLESICSQMEAAPHPAHRQAARHLPSQKRRKPKAAFN